jgi:thiol:disulfide interchange protein DsbC
MHSVCLSGIDRKSPRLQSFPDMLKPTMKKPLLSLLMGTFICFSQPLLAEGNPTKTIEDALNKVAPGLKPSSIKLSKVAGLYEVVAGSKTFYMSEDGKYLVEGKLTDINANKRATEIPGIYEFVSGSKLYYVTQDGNYFIEGSLIDVNANKDLTEARLGEARIAQLEMIGLDNMLVFKPKKTKYVIYVFTDIDCGYCRKLHSEIEQYLSAGIEVRYLFFPRAGVDSDSYNKAVAVWCAKDRNAALTKAKKGESIEMKQCENPVKAHMKLGEELGATGTPMIVTGRGTIIPGYVDAIRLSQGLEKEAKK